MTQDKPEGDLTDSEAVASDDGEPRAEMEALQKADTDDSREFGVDSIGHNSEDSG